MYEELVKRLREESEIERWLQPHSANETPKLLDDAADAIESTNKAYQMISEAYEAEVTKQNWISVTERLPKTRESILGKKSSKVIVAFRFDDGTQGTDTAHTLNGEWVFEDHITVVARTITHWMPLPSAPTEE